MKYLHLLALSLCCFLVGPAYGAERHVVLAVDLGIYQVAGGGAASVNERIIALLAENIDPADSTAVVTFGREARVEKNFAESGISLPDLLAGITQENGPASLAAGLKAAAALYPPESREALLLVITAGGDDSGRAAFAMFDQLLRQGISIRVFLPPASSPPPEFHAAWTGRAIEFRELSPVLPGHPGITATVRRLVAARAGIEADGLALKAEFLQDLGFDQLKAYEVVEAVCSYFGIPAPRDSQPETVAALAAYIDSRRGQGRAVVEGDIENAPRYASITGKKQSFEQSVFYATNRGRTGKTDPSDFYGGDRAAGGKLSYGRCLVTIPLNHKKGAMESPFLGLKFLDDESLHVRLAQVTPMSREELFGLVKSSLHAVNPDEGWENDVVIFIHGFNVTFADAAKRTAQMAYDFGFKGAPLMFSWPSDGKLFAYMSDREDVNWSIAHIEEFVEQVIDGIMPRRVHLVAHSMGNQGLIGALNMLALRRSPEKRPFFENVILAAPDFDAQLFQEQIAPRVLLLANRWTVYTSDKDAALNVSSTINSAKRLGLPVTPMSGIDVVDATGIEVTPWSVPEFHSYYATKQTVIQDIVSTIRGIAPTKRNLLPRAAAGLPYWRLAAPGK